MKPSTQPQSPREIFQAAMAAPPLTHDELVAKQCQVAAVAAEDDRKREPVPQLPLEVAA